jgi:phosphatidylglycerophosphatase C
VGLAVFDLDGTITWRDSFVPYVAGFLWRHPAYCRRLWRVPGPLLRYLLDRDRGRLKESLIIGLLRAVDRATLDAWTNTFAEELIASGTRPLALEQIRMHRDDRDRLVLLSASPDLYVTRIGERLRFDEVICTGVRWDGDRLDGHLTTQNRRAEEKARCIKQLRVRCPGMRVVAYGNSASDLPHLQLADDGWLISTRSGLTQRAAALGLRTASWG